MPKEHFQAARITPLKELPPGARIHFIGVCGVAMAQLAVLLSNRGYSVSGSDKEFYEPMGSLLRSSRVTLFEGYRGSNVPFQADLVVIGNAISYGHEEVAVVEERNLPYSIFPQLLFETIISGKHSIVVSGTHGKSTTTALAQYVLSRGGLRPAFFIGGAVKGLPLSLDDPGGPVSVVEGDEYDSAFFAKVPKFSFYRPRTLIVTSVEYDHADIYPDLASINREFSALVCGLPAEACVISCLDDENLARLTTDWKRSARCEILTYGACGAADLELTRTRSQGLGQSFSVRLPDGRELGFSLPLTGEYNAKNAIAVLIAAGRAGLGFEQAGAALAEFPGVKRRQDLRFDGAVTLIEDFAHHPTAVRVTLKGIRQSYPKRRIWAAFEPRSNTSRRKVFQDAYVSAFKPADRVLLCNVSAKSIDAGQELLEVSQLGRDIESSGTQCRTCPDPDSIETILLEEVLPGDVFVLMSNGAFGGLAQRLETKLRERFGREQG